MVDSGLDGSPQTDLLALGYAEIIPRKSRGNIFRYERTYMRGEETFIQQVSIVQEKSKGSVRVFAPESVTEPFVVLASGTISNIVLSEADYGDNNDTNIPIAPTKAEVRGQGVIVEYASVDPGGRELIVNGLVLKGYCPMGDGVLVMKPGRQLRVRKTNRRPTETPKGGVLSVEAGATVKIILPNAESSISPGEGGQNGYLIWS